jgi:hypothetical protein
MFDFQKLEVYKKAKELNRDILVLLSENKFDRHINDQLKRATFSILLNFAEGSSRFSRTLPSSPALTLVFSPLRDLALSHPRNLSTKYEQITLALF